MSDEPGWRPSGAPYDAARPDRFAVVHFWASWNRVDQEMDSRLKRLSDLFDESFALRSCDFDREENKPLVEQARVVNLPALAIVIRGEPHETIIGLRSETELRSRILEWRARTVTVATGGWSVARALGPTERGDRADELVPSPDSAFAAVLYSCNEFSLGKFVGKVAILEGPAANPRVVFRPSGFDCAAFWGPSIRWLNRTTCVLSVCSWFFGRAYLKMDERTVGFERGRYPWPWSVYPKRFFVDGVREVPVGLPWYSWEWVERHWQEAGRRGRLPLAPAVSPRNPSLWRRLIGGW